MTTVEDVVFKTESYAEIIGDLIPLLEEHWKELASYKDIPLDPDFHLYKKMDDLDQLAIYTARFNGDLIGYSIFFVRPSHHHYLSAAWAFNDIVWIRPDHRKLGVGRAFVAHWDQDMRKRGVDVVHINAKVSHPALAYLLKDCDYKVVEAGYEKRIL